VFRLYRYVVVILVAKPTFAAVHSQWETLWRNTLYASFPYENGIEIDGVSNVGFSVYHSLRLYYSADVHAK